MNIGLQKLVDQGFMTEEQAKYIDEAVENKSTIFVSGHKGWGILPLLATIGNMAKEKYSVKQVKGFDCLADATDCYIIAAPKETDMEQLVIKALANKGTNTIAIKDPDHPYSIMKALKSFYKETGDVTKTIEVLECAKVDDEKKLCKITRMTMVEGGKINKQDL